MRFKGLIFILFASTFQLLSIYLAYIVLYYFASLFHSDNSSNDGGGMDFYGLTLYYLIWFVCFSIFITTFLEELFKNQFVVTTFQILWILFIIWFTKGDLLYRPYDYGLILFCICLSIPFRIMIRKFFHQ